jgi:hypothetical protein
MSETPDGVFEMARRRAKDRAKLIPLQHDPNRLEDALGVGADVGCCVRQFAKPRHRE